MPVTSSMLRVTPAQKPKSTKGSWKACRYVYWLALDGLGVVADDRRIFADLGLRKDNADLHVALLGPQRPLNGLGARFSTKARAASWKSSVR